VRCARRSRITRHPEKDRHHAQEISVFHRHPDADCRGGGCDPQELEAGKATAAANLTEAEGSYGAVLVQAEEDPTPANLAAVNKEEQRMTQCRAAAGGTGEDREWLACHLAAVMPPEIEAPGQGSAGQAQEFSRKDLVS
jgi:hypothetical protein